MSMGSGGSSGDMVGSSQLVWDPAPLCVFVLDKVKLGEPGPWLVVRAGEL